MAIVHKKDTAYIMQCGKIITDLTQSERATSYDDTSKWDKDCYILCNDCWEEYTNITEFTNANS